MNPDSVSYRMNESEEFRINRISLYCEHLRMGNKVLKNIAKETIIVIFIPVFLNM